MHEGGCIPDTSASRSLNIVTSCSSFRVFPSSSASIAPADQQAAAHDLTNSLAEAATLP